MKKIISITAIVILFSLTITAQGNQRGINQKSNLTSEQRVDLQTKKMALKLDLDVNQQKEVKKILLKSADERNKIRDEFRQKKQSGELTADERFTFENNRLERQMVHKTEMKNILTKDQFLKWENYSNLKIHSRNTRMKNDMASKRGHNCFQKCDRKPIRNRG